MAYCSAAQVRAICDTDVTDAELGELTIEISALMDMKLDTASLNVNVRRLICRTWTAVTCMLKDPSTEALGEYRGSREYALEKLNKHLADMIKVASGGVAFSYSYEEVPRTYRATG